MMLPLWLHRPKSLLRWAERVLWWRGRCVSEISARWNYLQPPIGIFGTLSEHMCVSGGHIRDVGHVGGNVTGWYYRLIISLSVGLFPHQHSGPSEGIYDVTSQYVQVKFQHHTVCNMWGIFWACLRKHQCTFQGSLWECSVPAQTRTFPNVILQVLKFSGLREVLWEYLTVHMIVFSIRLNVF